MTGWVCTAGITIKVLNPSRGKGFAAAPAVEIWRAIVAKAAGGTCSEGPKVR